MVVCRLHSSFLLLTGGLPTCRVWSWEGHEFEWVAQTTKVRFVLKLCRVRRDKDIPLRIVLNVHTVRISTVPYCTVVGNETPIVRTGTVLSIHKYVYLLSYEYVCTYDHSTQNHW
jgi:hypothetical protein